MVEGLRTSSLGEMREGLPEVLEQLFIWLLRIGSGAAVSTRL